MNTLSYEMGYTPIEFKKALLGQFNSNTAYEITELGENSWSIQNLSESISIEVKIAVAAPRKIAMLTLPVLNTDFSFIEITDTQKKEFIKTFLKYFHKGGG